MARVAHCLKYEDLMHTGECVKKCDNDGVGTAVIRQLRDLYDDVQVYGGVRRFKDEEEAFAWDAWEEEVYGQDRTRQHPFETLYAKFHNLVKKVQAGHDVFIFLSGHGNYDGVEIGYPNGKPFKPEYVVQAFFEKVLRRQCTPEEWRQEPVTVVFLMNACNVTGRFEHAQGVSVPALTNAQSVYRKADAATFGEKDDWNRRLRHVGVRLAVLRPRSDHEAPMPKLLVPCFMQRLIERKSIQQALQLDVLDARMQRYAERYQKNAVRKCFPPWVDRYGWKLTPVAERSEVDREQEQTYGDKRLREDALSASGREGDKRKQPFKDIVPTQDFSLDRQTCEARTQKGRLCRRMAQPGGNLCKQHGLRSPPEISMFEQS